MKSNKPILFSAIKPTGKMHIGNFLGAINNWINLQNSSKYNCIYSIADLHALTIDINPKELKENSLDLIVDLLACGVDPKKSIFFVQSQVKEHSELAWIFNCITPVAEMERMTQYKDKSQQQKENINMGLLDYPALMAADILLYKSKIIPVGDDQNQHVELTRKIVRKFNLRWGNFFEEPKTVLTQIPRVMSLTHPDKKMSKSLGEKSYIALSDSPEKIKNKIKSAVTTEQGAKNLLNLFEQFSTDQKLINKFKKEFKSNTIKYSEFKPELAKAIIQTLQPIQKRRQKYLTNPKKVARIINNGTKRAKKIASNNLKQIKQIIGLTT